MKKKENRKKERSPMYTPMQMTEALQKLGEQYSARETAVAYAALFVAALVMGFLFELKIPAFLVVCAVYLLCTPSLLYNYKVQKYELRRFTDVNAYMSQMAKSFVKTKNIYASMKETSLVFKQGRMKETMAGSLEIIEKGSRNVDEAIRESLHHIEERYDCEKIRNLHEFLLMSQNRGGEYETEFKILERTRKAWESSVSEYREKQIESRNMSAAAYGLLLAVCIIMLRQIPEELSIIGMDMVQIVDTLILSGFIPFFVIADRRINKSLLTDPEVMSREEADSLFKSLKGATSEREKKKRTVYILLVTAGTVCLWYASRSSMIPVIGIALIVFMLNLEKIAEMSSRSILKKEIMKAYPKWLFDIMLLIQRQSVDSAIIRSVDTAPPVLQAELQRISNVLMRVDGNTGERLLSTQEQISDAYLSFMADFEIGSIEEGMRTLYSLSAGTGGSAAVMESIIDENMDLLTQAEKKSLQIRGDSSKLQTNIPTIVITLAMISYSIALVITAFGMILGLLQ